ncbi:unnamed protein product [Macrosiphum euphorbiae]|uniref:Uncharacterized protein n=1 Tax=Macrosiphum euphorbiae TaxID=13131 RepID=A0AAV0VVW0_9HEMI|nr:unnamed protein product [Macrosiphum euphorbiae]
MSNTESPYAAFSKLGQCLGTQGGGIKLLLSKALALESVKGKIRSDEVKSAVNELLNVVRALEVNNKNVVTSYNETKRVFKKEEENRVNVQAMKSTVDMETQSPCWWDAEHPAERFQKRPSPADDPVMAPDPAGPTWTEIVKRRTSKKRNSPPQGEQGNGALGVGDTATAKPRVRARPSAIIVDVKSEDFPALARKIRGGVDQGVIGDSIIGMRQAKAGGLLIEVRGDQARFDAVRAEISRSAGSEVEVRALQQRAMVEVRDLDQWSTVEEVAAATAAATGILSEQLKVFSLRKRFGGSQSALVLLPIGFARVLLNSGRLRVGMVSCRVRLAEQKLRY